MQKFRDVLITLIVLGVGIYALANPAEPSNNVTLGQPLAAPGWDLDVVPPVMLEEVYPPHDICVPGDTKAVDGITFTCCEEGQGRTTWYGPEVPLPGECNESPQIHTLREDRRLEYVPPPGGVYPLD